MELPSYLSERDLQNINYLLNPVQDFSEVDTRAAEASLSGGAFSGARRKRMRDSEQIGRYQLGNSMLAPYLARQQQAQSQTQAEQAAAARQVEQNNAELQRLQLQLQNADQRQAQEIAARMRELNTQNQAAMERLQLSEQGAASRLGIQEQGQNQRLQTGLQADMDRLNQQFYNNRALQGDQLNASMELARLRETGENTRQQNALSSVRNQQSQYSDNATLNAVNRILGGLGNSRSRTPSGSSGGSGGFSQLGSQMPVNSTPLSPVYSGTGESYAGQFGVSYDLPVNTPQNQNWGVSYDLAIPQQQSGSFADDFNMAYDLGGGQNTGSIDDYLDFEPWS